MILPANDLIDWVADREGLLICAWTPQIEAMLGWERPYAELLSSELHACMMTTMLGGGTEQHFLELVARSNTGIDPRMEQTVAGRFHRVTLKLARAASRQVRNARTSVTPYKYGSVVADRHTDPAHLLIADVLLPQSHSFWTRWHPPFGPDCRCSTGCMTRTQFARSGRSVTSDVELSRIEAGLIDSWPVEFVPLLDFRLPLGSIAAGFDWDVDQQGLRGPPRLVGGAGL